MNLNMWKISELIGCLDPEIEFTTSASFNTSDALYNIKELSQKTSVEYRAFIALIR